MVQSIFHQFSLSATGNGVSGSDRIFIEFAREWSKNIPVTIYTTKEGVEMCARQQLTGNKLTINKIEKGWLPSNFLLKYLYKIFLGVRLGLTWSPHNTLYKIHNTLLYSSSDFWMDVFPAVILKIRYPKVKWVATWYQTAPNPVRGFVEESTKYHVSGIKNQPEDTIQSREHTYNFSALAYWLSQLPIKPLIKKYADYVIVNNEDERKRFPKMNGKKKVIVLLGAVRLDQIENWKLKNTLLRAGLRKGKENYDAVFQGRFHPQKGVVELIDIWKKVVDVIPNAKLAMIGDGPLKSDVVSRIKYHDIERNVKLFGYLFDGEEKYKIFAQSKIVVHPAFYDSGGMASAEAMAFGLPCVGFDLKAYKSYYPKGMIKVKAGDINAFSNAIIKLITNERQRLLLGKEAAQLIKNDWSWSARTQVLFHSLKIYE